MNDEIKKQLESLFCWYEFYRINQRHDDANKTNEQIRIFKEKNNLT